MTALFLLALSSIAKADNPDFSQMTNEQLVDSLQSIKEETVGIDSVALAVAFLPEGKPARFGGGVLGTPAPVIYPQMRILVERGIKALPVLLEHIDDARPTQLSVPHHGFVIWSSMAEEYAPRVPEASEPAHNHLDEPEVKLPYVVKVGDVCFALIGQIVGRPLQPVRYQPTGGMIINSPVASKKLADEVRKDWTNLTEDEFRLDLVDDAAKLENPFLIRYPLRSLRYFFPDEYARQRQGVLKEKIPWFEKLEKEGML